MRCVEINLVLVLAVTISIFQTADCWHRWHSRRYGGGWNQPHNQDISLLPHHPFGFHHEPAWHTLHPWTNSSPYRQYGRRAMRHWGHGRWPHHWNTQETSGPAVAVPNRLTGPQIPMLTSNPFFQTTIRPFSTARPILVTSTASATSTVSRRLRPQLRFGGDVPRDAATVDWEDYENEMKKYDDKKDYN